MLGSSLPEGVKQKPWGKAQGTESTKNCRTEHHTRDVKTGLKDGD